MPTIDSPGQVLRPNEAIGALAAGVAFRLDSAGRVVTALAIGLALGMAISGLVGWQVPKGLARAQVGAAVFEQQASFCENQARAEMAQPRQLSVVARRDLAGKWAVMPGAILADPGVVAVCARKLAA